MPPSGRQLARTPIQNDRVPTLDDTTRPFSPNYPVLPAIRTSPSLEERNARRSPDGPRSLEAQHSVLPPIGTPTESPAPTEMSKSLSGIKAKAKKKAYDGKCP